MNIKKYSLFILISTLVLSSCSERSVDDLVSSVQVLENETITYNNSISSIINSTCTTCHAATPINGAPMSLTTYSQVRDAVLNNGLNDRINNISAPMPPTGLMPEANRTIIQEWIDNGFPEN